MNVDGQTNDPIAAQLARFVTGLRYEDLPADIVACAKTLILDQFSCELIGSTLPWVRPAMELVEMTRGVRPESTVVNHGSRFLAADVAFINATFGQACEMDDSNRGHNGTATIPVALAMGEREHIDGRLFITSIIAGYEVIYRLMDAIRPHHDTRGFHSQSIAGPFASAAVAGKILRMDRDHMVHALAIAGSHSCGSTEYDQSGGEVKRIHAGLATRGGIHAALLAERGLTGPPTIIEGKRGFCNIFAGQSEPSRITDKLGERFNIPHSHYKMYPAAGGVHTSITAVDRLATEHAIRAADVARIRIGLAEHVLLHGAGISRPHDVISAQFSLAFSVALAISKRSNDLAHYMNAALWSDPEIVGLMDRVETYAHPRAQGDNSRYAAVTIALNDGRSFETEEPFVVGSWQNPATKEQLEGKVRKLSGTVLTAARIDRLMETVAGLENLEDVADLAKLLVQDRGGSS